MRYKNYTPHMVSVLRKGMSTLTFYPEPQPIRLKTNTTIDEDGIAIITTEEAQPLPPQEPRVCLIVSTQVKARYPERTDLRVPAKIVKSEDGIPIACAALCA